MSASKRPALPDIPPPPQATDLAGADGRAADQAVKERLRAAGEPLGFGHQGRGRDQAAAAPAPASTRSMQLIVPEYLFEELGLSAVRRRVTKRYLILEALQKAGYAIRGRDMDEDGRRRR